MNNYKLLTIISDRKNENFFIEFLHKFEVNNVIEEYCNGTADESMLNILGLLRVEKIMISCAIKKIYESEILEYFQIGKIQDYKEKSIAYFSKIDSFGGVFAKEYFIDENRLNLENSADGKGDKYMEVMTKYVLVKIIIDKGNVESVMSVARKSGATGGTVVKAKGTGKDIAKLFGMNISEEKEIINILINRQIRDDFLTSIMNFCKTNPSMHGVVFTIPVESISGVSLNND